MADVEFDIDELEEYTKQLVNIASKKLPKETKKFLRKEGSKLQRKTKQRAKRDIEKSSGDKKSYVNSIKRGKPYKYIGDEDAVRVFSMAPHAHLIELGHVKVVGGKRGKGGCEVGYVRGKYIFRKTAEEFEKTFYDDTEKFIDDILDKGLL